VPAPRSVIVVGIAATWLLVAFLLDGCGDEDPYVGETERAAEQSSGWQHPVHIHIPESIDGSPRVATGRTDAQGRPVTVACSSCHATASAVDAVTSDQGLDRFHQGLQLAHGSLSCLSCHDADNYDRLHLADGRSIDYRDTMRLCAQCHGPQHRDYQNGSHGGMSGHWDRERGERRRNHCIDCHDAHAPAYPRVQPAPPPRDTSGVGREGHDHGEQP